MVLSSQRRQGNESSKKGSTTWVEHFPRARESTEDVTELFGGKQLAYAFYMAYEEDSSNSNGQRVLHQEYQVNLFPRTLPLDVKIEIVHNGVTIAVLEMVGGVAEVQQAITKSFFSQPCELKDLRAERRLHILRHVRGKCEREPCGDVWHEVADIQRGESHLPPMGARLCSRPEPLDYRMLLLRH